MARGRRPLAAEIKEITGAYRKNPQRKNAAAPVSDGLTPDMPHWFGPLEVEKWNELCGDLGRLKVLASDTREILVAYCTAYRRWREARDKVDETGLAITEIGKDGNATLKRNPYVTEEQKYREHMNRLLPELGLTPASRQKLTSLKLDDDKADDPFAGLMERMGRG
jgi:P27 family predicted phage terminase small subunit